MMRLEFTKMQGLGNDFVVVDGTTQTFQFTPQQISTMADRRLGIGFDQLLLLESAGDASADFNYRIFNADGGEVAMCGNGARCVARFIQQRGLSDQASVRLQTQAGVITTRLIASQQVSVEMGVPQLSPPDIPLLVAQQALEYTTTLAGDIVHFGALSIGNPHAVIRVDDVASAAVEQWSAALLEQNLFPKGVNVGFMQVISANEIQLRVFERGAGETQACGSGMCAAVVSGRQRGWLAEQVTVSQVGGQGMIDWAGPEKAVWLTGPAEFVYQGIWT